MADWSPADYGRFADLRLRPALDLLTAVDDLPPGDIVDLGCGSGAAGAALVARYPGRRMTGVDSSPAMLAAAGASGVYDSLQLADAALWQAESPPALIFSNAALHWLPGHRSLLPRLAGMLLPGGVLAVQMPRQFHAPSHALLRQIAARLFPDRFDFSAADVPVHSPEAYHALLQPLGSLTLWETEYFQSLPAAVDGHPVRAFTASTAMRPFLEKMSAEEAAVFVAAYDAELWIPYPRLPDGGVLFPFRRLFFILKV